MAALLVAVQALLDEQGRYGVGGGGVGVVEDEVLDAVGEGGGGGVEVVDVAQAQPAAQRAQLRLVESAVGEELGGLT